MGKIIFFLTEWYRVWLPCIDSFVQVIFIMIKINFKKTNMSFIHIRTYIVQCSLLNLKKYYIKCNSRSSLGFRICGVLSPHQWRWYWIYLREEIQLLYSRKSRLQGVPLHWHLASLLGSAALNSWSARRASLLGSAALIPQAR